MGLKKGSKISAEFNMSSLTDIIFLLLIFFMLTSSLVNPTAINLKLPSSSNQKAKVKGKPIVLKVDAKGRYSVNENTVAKVELYNVLKQYVDAKDKPAKDISVILNIDESAGAQTLVEVVDVINKVGTKMILATKLSKK